MYELKQVGERTYYIDCPAKMGLYRYAQHTVCLIDSGNDKEAGRKALKIIQANGWDVGMIINTHAHADHIGGNAFVQQRTHCPIYAPNVDACFAQYPALEGVSLYGGCVPNALRNKFLCAQASQVQLLTADVLPDGLQMMRIDGHSLAQVAIHTDDDVWFLADCVTSEAILEKYHVSFLFDVAQYFETLDAVERLQGACFIPSHAQPCTDIRPLVQKNRTNAQALCALIVQLCAEELTMEALVAAVFAHYALTMDFTQYALVGSTLRSYVSYLLDCGQLCAHFAEHRLILCATQAAE